MFRLGGSAERDNWESNCFSELIASGDSVHDLVDARVGCSRLRGEPAQRTIPKQSRYLYFLHISVLASWVESKYGHAEAFRDKVIQNSSQPSSAHSMTASLSDSVWSQMMAELQIKKAEVLVFIIGVGQQMKQVEQAQINGLLGFTATAAASDNLIAVPDVSSPGDIVTYSASKEGAFPAQLKEWWAHTIIEQCGQSPSLHFGSTMPTLAQDAIPAMGKLLPLLKSMLEPPASLELQTAQHLLSVVEELSLELRAFCHRLQPSASDSQQVRAATEVSTASSSTAVVDAAVAAQDRHLKRRRIQPTAC